MSVLAPSLTAAAGVPAEQIGWLAGLVALGTVWFLVGSSKLLADIESVRLLQLGVLLSAFGLLLALLGYWPATLLAALLVGLGYGPAPPAGNQVLISFAPKAHQGLIFSIKQSGAPIGSALAGLLLPLLAGRYGWATALAIAACLAGTTALVIEPFQRRLSTRQSHPSIAMIAPLFSPRLLGAPFIAIREAPGLIHLACAGFTFATVQGSLFALYVTYLVTTVGTDLAAAGAAFATMQLGGAVARIMVGWLADKVRAPLLVLASIGVASSVVIAITGAMQLDWGWSAILTISALVGLCAAGWNGVLMSEIAKASPLHRVGQITSAATFFIFVGYVLGPVSFAAILWYTSLYSAGFAFLQIFPIVGSAALIASYRQAQRRLPPHRTP